MTNMDQMERENDDSRTYNLKNHLLTTSKDAIVSPSENFKPLIIPPVSQASSGLKNSKNSSNVTTNKGKIKLLEVNSSLTCFLCKGYLIDATTISECLHSFCRSCIITFLQDKSHCPECDLVINKAKPNLKLDKTLQDIVYKLVPSLYVNEMTRRRKFYADKSAAITSQLAPEQRGDDTERIIFNAADKFSLCLDYAREDLTPEGMLLTIKKEDPDDSGNFLILNNNNEGYKNTRKNSTLLSTIPPGCENLMRRYLQCPGLCRIDVLKKFVRNKYNVDTAKFHIDILYKRVPLPDHYTLIDIAYIYSWKRNEPMKFFFRITDHQYVRDRFDFYDEENPMMVTHSSRPLVVSSPALSMDHIKVERTSPESVVTTTSLSPSPSTVVTTSSTSLTPSSNHPAKSVRFLFQSMATSTPIKPKSDKPRAGVVKVNKDKVKVKVKSEKKSKKLKPKKIPTIKSDRMKLTLSDLLEDSCKDKDKDKDNECMVKAEEPDLIEVSDKVTKTNVDDKINIFELLKPVESADNKTKLPMEDTFEKEQFLKSIQLLSTKVVDLQKSLSHQRQRKPLTFVRSNNPSGSTQSSVFPMKSILKTSAVTSSPSFKRKLSQVELSPRPLKKTKLATKKRVNNPKQYHKVLTPPPVSTTNSGIIPPEQPNLKNLLNTCKIPSSLSITCVNGQERETQIKPVINHIEILKLPEVVVPDSTKKPEVEPKPKVVSNEEKLEKMGTTLHLQSGGTTTPTPEIGKEEDKNKSELSISITVEKPKEESNGSKTTVDTSGIGVHPNLPKIIPPAPSLRSLTFQKMFEETLNNKLPSPPGKKVPPRVKPVLPVGKLEDKLGSESKKKKLKSTTTSLEVDPTSEPTPVTNAEGKVAIPRLKKTNNKVETLSNLHSNQLAMNYSVSVNQGSQGSTTTNTNSNNKDEHIVTSTTPKMDLSPKLGTGSSSVLKVAPPKESPKLKVLADYKLASKVSPNVTVSSSGTTPKPYFRVRPASPSVKNTSQTQNHQNRITPAPKLVSILKQPLPRMGTTPPVVMIQSPKASSPPKLDVNQLQEKYNLQNLAQLSASFNFPGVYVNPHQPNPFAALQQAMLLNQLHHQNMQVNRPNWFNLNPSNIVHYEKFLQSLGGQASNGAASGGHLLGKDN